MRNNFEKITKRNSITDEAGSEWADRKQQARKRHAKLNKTQRGTSNKRNWSEAIA
ncbi:hypothetical protein pEp_SNUABM10_00049 [Erwinia phage pEp_SNUABM_10]|uniref:Uncharacterized protein n=1 Tax=Erwinia phage pEp_SNUABM_09 TaxID=2601644 RepID=A0A5J6DBC4_9CAUD|nr:hypothetical protein pEpSNUABM09_47 [Erwinia phage pEp_SNUABM_09]QOC57648.1 hypothetical protein pEp_SNUABM03_00046 [Erwinia phage pEp_SNUABM_03]QOC57702.1 hypothetical protein pEp_SNUABM04_00048 [Erwinia phage pEp_SNUABM_04]QOC57753.1 hypothetical protein pEp_SNUABM10_00049 [Erwinia phage pEp_SNUABM_10]QOC57803.1 hypothetical protein pEp_SNUABM11_00047 [Erwinia phage pEp_SNUABM_11]